MRREKLPECRLCGLVFEEITWSHLKYSHSMTTSEYEERFPDADLVPFGLALRRGLSISKERQDNPRRLEPSHIQALREGHRKFLEDPVKYWSMVGKCIENNGKYERTDEMRAQRSEITKKVFEDPVVREKHSRAVSASNLGIPKSEEHCKNISEALQKVYQEGRGGFQKYGWNYSEERNRKVSESLKELWTDPEYKDRVVAAMMGRKKRKPTMPEAVVLYWLVKNFPSEWKYNGVWEGDPDNTIVVIGGRVPDFVRTDSEKLVIEVFGYFWHSDTDAEGDKIAHYAGNGFGCLVLWDDEVYSEEFVTSKVSRLLEEGDSR